jgi:hypothetical protein
MEQYAGSSAPSVTTTRTIWQDLPNIFAWLYSKSGRILPNSISLPRERIDKTWRPPSMVHSWGAVAPLELVRYAGANHLCVEITYDGTTRLIEPYDLKRTQDGNLLLIAIKHKTSEWRSYRVDQIEKIEVTNVTFTPRYLISLTSYSH